MCSLVRYYKGVPIPDIPTVTEIVPTEEQWVGIREALVAVLSNQDTAIVIDASSSTKANGTHKEATDKTRLDLEKEIALGIADEACARDEDGIQCYILSGHTGFTTKPRSKSGIKSKQDLAAFLKPWKPDNTTPLIPLLADILDKHVQSCKDNWATKRLNLVVIADGGADPDDEGRTIPDLIRKAAFNLYDLGLKKDVNFNPKEKLGIEFALATDDVIDMAYYRCIDAMEYILQSKNQDGQVETRKREWDIVDVTYWQEIMAMKGPGGELSTAKLLAGSNHVAFDNLGENSELVAALDNFIKGLREKGWSVIEQKPI